MDEFISAQKSLKLCRRAFLSVNEILSKWLCNTCFCFPSGGGDREALSGAICQRLQIQRHPQSQWRSMWPLPSADSFPGVWMPRRRKRQVLLHCPLSTSFSSTKSSPLSDRLFVNCLCCPCNRAHLWCKEQRSSATLTSVITSRKMSEVTVLSHKVTLLLEVAIYSDSINPCFSLLS